jgi:hypothetical protein
MTAETPSLAPGAELPAWICRALGLPEGVRLELPRQSVPAGVLVIRPDRSDRVFLPLDAVDGRTAGRSPVFLRILPLGLAEATTRRGVALGRWRREWIDLTSPARPEEGLLRSLSSSIRPSGRPPVLPPLYLCKEKQAFVAAVCLGCHGPSDASSTSSEGACPACGSAGRRETTREIEPDSAADTLWARARRTGTRTGEAADLLDPYCASCERREICFPDGGPSREPGTAMDLLIPISESPWGGIVVEPFHLPFWTWSRLAGGAPWARVRETLRDHPPSVLQAADARIAFDRTTLYERAAGSAHGLETLLIRLAVLHQVLSGLAGISSRLGHPHLGLTGEGIWIRLEPAQGLRTALWSARAVLLDPAPAWFAEGGDDGIGEYVFATDRDPHLTPPGCERHDDWAEGLCIPRAATASPGGGIRVNFLPNAQFSRSPSRGDAVVLAFPAEPTSGVERRVRAIVEVALPDFCNVVVADPSVPEEEVRSWMAGPRGAAARLKVLRDHSLVDDLFASGTLWIASLMRLPGELRDAARFRDDLAPRLRGLRGDAAITAETERAMRESGLFPVSGEGDRAGSGPESDDGLVLLDPVLLARAVALGMRLCGATPGGYPFQDHEPVGPEERALAHETVLAEVVGLSREIREHLLGGNRPHDEIVGALVEYLGDRLRGSEGGAGRREGGKGTR